MKQPAGGVAVHPAALLTAIGAAVFVLYSGTAAFGFVLDDVYQVLDTAAIHSWRPFFDYFRTPTFATPYYRPLLLAWFRVNDALFGAQPAGWHLSSVALHVAVTALVYALARRLGGSTAVALASALLFGVHPIHIESAAWISDACDPLCAIFFLAAFLAYVRGEQTPADTGHRRAAWLWKAIAAAAYVLALWSKEPALAFPAVAGAYTLLYLDGSWRDRLIGALRGILPFAVITAAYWYVHEVLTSSALGSRAQVSLATAVLTAPSLVLFYLKKLFVPVGLSAFYDPAYVHAAGLRDFWFPLLALLIAAGAVGLWYRKARDSRLIAFAAWWFVLTLAPALDARRLPHDGAVHDRYLYLPSVAFALLLAAALERLAERAPAAQRKPALAAAVLGVAIVLVALNLPQQVFWANDYLLYRRGVDIAPRNDQARNNFGRVLAERGEFHAAEAFFTDILRRHPDSSLAHYNLGFTLYRQGRYGEAEAHLARAVAGEPENPFMHLYLGLTAMHEGKLGLAEQEVGTAVRMRPGHKGFHLALGYVLEAKGDLRGALQETQTELANTPDNAAIRQRLAALEAKVR